MNASGARHKHTFVYEAGGYGVAVATPAMKKVRLTSDSLKLEIENLVSAEIVGDRQIHDSVNGARKVTGDIGFELSYGSHDDLLEGLLGGTWAPRATITATTISAQASDNSFNDSGNGFVTAGFKAGDPVVVTGFTGNVANNIARGVLTTVAAGKLTISGTDGDVIVDDAAGESVTITALTQVLKAGSTFRSYLMQRLFEDVGVYLRFPGCVLNTLNLQVGANAIVTGTIGVIGKDQVLSDAPIAGTTYPAAPTTAPNVSFRGVMKKNGTVTSAVTELTVSLENNVDPLYVVGDPTGQLPVIGNSNVTGQITVLFQGPDELEAFINGDEQALESNFLDALGNKIKLILPRVKYTAAPPDVKDDGLVPLVIPLQALYDDTTGSNIIFERTPA